MSSPELHAAPHSVVVRHAIDADREALERLAALDSAAPVTGAALVAIADGELVAARSLIDGRVVADPFRPTAAHVELLRVRALQLGAHEDRRPPGLRRRLRLGAATA